jgi:hypothetical protein
MNILILDDQEIIFRAPADYYVEPHDFRGDNVVQVARPDQFFEQFELGYAQWDLIMLDHDLGDPTCSGRDITKCFAEMGNDGRTFSSIEIWITSMNPPAADSMYEDLKRYTDATVWRQPMSRLNDLGISRGGTILPFTQILRRPSGFLVMP